VSSLDLQRPSQTQDGSVTAHLSLAEGASYAASAHAVNLLLTDAQTGAVVPITYRKNTTMIPDARGNVATVKVTLPAGTNMPASVRAYVVTDVYPLLVKVF
jgi:hypothetical protein